VGGVHESLQPHSSESELVWQVMAVVAHEGWWRGHLVVDRFAKSEQLCSDAKKLRCPARQVSRDALDEACVWE